MKIIFLDIDGVLNNSISNYEFDPVSVACLNLLIEATGAKVVITSLRKETEGMKILRSKLLNAGFTGGVIGGTPIMKGETKNGLVIETDLREKEILLWLSLAKKYNSELDFVIFDDVSQYKVLIKNFVYVDKETGLGPQHIEIAGK